ncbi:MAG: DUF6273 domain-containing protein [Lachnospiraceae bacterium]|nr:DUF6273 domain-containing protein [Lachnospiraceae bacterium]
MICPNCGAIIEEPDHLIMGKDVITFGSYRQDTKTREKTPVRWRVLEKSDGKLKVISSEVLDCGMFDEGGHTREWEWCSLRKWLNEEFLNEAFSPEERERILENRVKNPGNERYGTPGGRDTLDKIFLLSIEEVNRYFYLNGYYRDSCCRASGYAVSRGASRTGSGNCKWWLRTPGSDGNEMINAAIVLEDGRISYYGANSQFGFVGIRPVLVLSDLQDT